MKQLNLFQNPTAKKTAPQSFHIEINQIDPTAEFFWEKLYTLIFPTISQAVQFFKEYSEDHPNAGALKLVDQFDFIYYVYDPSRNPKSRLFN